MAGSVIDEFLLGIKMTGDPSKLVDAYKQIFAVQEEYEKKQKDQNEADKKAESDRIKKEQQEVNSKRTLWAKYGAWRKKQDEKTSETKEGREQFKKDLSAGVDVIKQGISVARGWAVALLAVDGAAMSVIGRLSQMSVEYQNTAEATGTSAAEMKAWEDTVKAAGGTAQDVQSSLGQLYSHARNLQLHGGEGEYSAAMSYFGVSDVDAQNKIRNSADIFSDLVTSIQKKLKEGADPALLQQYMEDTGMSANLIAALKAREGGQYMVNQGQYQKYLGRAQSMDELAGVSRGMASDVTDLSSLIRDKVTKVLVEIANTGVLQDILDDLKQFVEGIDADKVAETTTKLITALDSVITWVANTFGWIIGTAKDVKNGYQVVMDVHDQVQDTFWNAVDSTKAKVLNTLSDTALQQKKLDALRDALQGKMSRAGYAVFSHMTKGETPDVISAYESKAREYGINVGDIYSQAGINVSNNIKVMIDGKEIPYKVSSSTSSKTTPPRGIPTYGGTKQ